MNSTTHWTTISPTIVFFSLLSFDFLPIMFKMFSRVHRAGPREKIFFKPEEVKAAIVTCGGLCPGLNDVIRQVSL